MNREILFRGKRLDNGEWVEGDLRQDKDLKTVYISGYDYYTSAEGLPREPYEYEVIPDTVCQYTGLTDRNGRKIFEGDIVNCAENECCGDITWNESEAGFYFCVLLDGGGFEEEHLYDYVDELEVIGNIFDSPELLEGGNE